MNGVFSIESVSQADTVLQPLAQMESLREVDFLTLIEDKVSKVDKSVKSAKSSLVDHLTGGDTQLHEVIMEMSSAQSQIKFYVQVRDRLLESYKEISRMQV